jgi:hypothetical protein
MLNPRLTALLLCVLALPAAETPAWNEGFSTSLAALPTHPEAATTSVAQMHAATLQGATLPPGFADMRLAILGMYRSLSLDPSLESGTYSSALLRARRPATWSSSTPTPLSGDYLQPYSIDACFYHPIPRDTPRVDLPAGYVRRPLVNFNGQPNRTLANVQINTVTGWDQLGYVVHLTDPAAPARQIINDNFAAQSNTGFNRVTWNVPDSLLTILAGLGGDRAVSFINPSTQTIIHTIGLSIDANGDYHASFSPGPLPLASLGDNGGTIATGMTDSGMLVRPGEANDAARPIPHALMLGVNRMWSARVYPATSGDAAVWNLSLIHI